MESGKPEGVFGFNSDGACPVCKGKGVIVTELAFMDPIVTECEACGGMRYNEDALACTYKGRNIVELLNLTASQALDVFEDAKIIRRLKVMQKVGLSYLTLGQSLSTLSVGERQRIKLAKNLGKKGGEVVFTGTPQKMVKNAQTLTADSLRLSV